MSRRAGHDGRESAAAQVLVLQHKLTEAGQQRGRCQAPMCSDRDVSGMMAGSMCVCGGGLLSVTVAGELSNCCIVVVIVLFDSCSTVGIWSLEKGFTAASARFLVAAAATAADGCSVVGASPAAPMRSMAGRPLYFFVRAIQEGMTKKERKFLTVQATCRVFGGCSECLADMHAGARLAAAGFATLWAPATDKLVPFRCELLIWFQTSSLPAVLAGFASFNRGAHRRGLRKLQGANRP